MRMYRLQLRKGPQLNLSCRVVASLLTINDLTREAQLYVSALHFRRTEALA